MKTVRTRRAGTDEHDAPRPGAPGTSGRSRPSLNRSPVSALPQLHQIVLPTPWPVGPVQVYVVEGDPVTLIDTGVKTPESLATLGSALESLGLGLEDVRRVVLTHQHADHLGQAESLRAAGADLEVHAHEAEAPFIEQLSPAPDEQLEDANALFREYGVPDVLLEQQTEWLTRRRQDEPVLCEPTRVEQRLRSGDRIPFKDFELHVIHTPGHTAGHIVLHDPGSGALITGDHVMGDAVPYTDNYYVDGPPDPRDPLGRRPRFKGLPAYTRSLRELRRESFTTILPAHGGIIRRADRAIEDALLFYDVRVQRIERGLRTLAAMGQPVTGWEIWRALFPKADPRTEMRKRMLMVIGALDALEESGACMTQRRDDGVLVHLRP